MKQIIEIEIYTFVIQVKQGISYFLCKVATDHPKFTFKCQTKVTKDKVKY